MHLAEACSLYYIALPNDWLKSSCQVHLETISGRHFQCKRHFQSHFRPDRHFTSTSGFDFVGDFFLSFYTTTEVKHTLVVVHLCIKFTVVFYRIAVLVAMDKACPNLFSSRRISTLYSGSSSWIHVLSTHSQPQQTPATKHQTVYALAWIYPAFLLFSLFKPLKELSVELHDRGHIHGLVFVCTYRQCSR